MGRIPALACLPLSLYVNVAEPFDEALRRHQTEVTVERLHDGLD